MRLLALRIPSLFLVLQQLTFALPARALVNLQAGLPVDGPALAALGGGSGSGATGSISGDFSYRYPIYTPPGTGGFTPSVALAYSSGDARRAGPVGAGWRIDIGPAVLQRSTRDGAPEYDASDAYELAGQRLEATATAGRYVSENYDFSRIEHITQGGDYWRVLRPNGTRLYYGFDPGIDPSTGSIVSSVQVDATDPTSTLCNPFVPCTERETIIGAGIPFAWYLDRVEDRHGNVVRFDWESLGDAGMRYLGAITYSEHVAGAVGQVPGFGGSDDGTLTRTREILFYYDAPSRSDTLPTYRTGFPRQISSRLESIEVRVGGSLVRRYELQHHQSPASGRLRLDRIQERNASGAGTDQLETLLGYGDGGSAGWSALQTAWALPAGLAFTANGVDQGVRLVDVNTDGYPDVVHANGTSLDTHLGGPVDAGRPAAFDAGATPAWALPIEIVGSEGYRGTVFADLDGDGRLDVLRREIEITGQIEENEDCGGDGGGYQHEVIQGTQGVLESNDALINTGSGWLHDPNQAAPSFAYDMVVFEGFSTGDGCAHEYLPSADRVEGVPGGFDQGMRVLDLDGDARADLVYFRFLTGWAGSTHIDETRSGTLLNSVNGLAWSSPNIAHDSTGIRGLIVPIVSSHRRHYASPRWQVPVEDAPDSAAWSILSTCRSSNPLVESMTGAEQLVDLNADGLVDILEGSNTLSRVSVNHGYGWKPPTLAPETSLTVPALFLDVELAGLDILQAFCVPGGQGSATDYGVRMLDVNGDGGPDVIDGQTVSLWRADGPPFWLADPSWDAPVSFSPGSAPAGGVRLADVDNDGLVDIVGKNGAYLNVAEPPDLLQAVTTPWGATTTVTYEPHTVLDVAPTDNPTSQGQYELPGARWVTTRIDTDPGAAFAEPVITQEFEYYDPIYDVEDRAFRGFREVVAFGPVVDGVRGATETFYHTSDALRGRPRQSIVSSVDVSANPGDPGAWVWTTLREARHDYAHASAGDGGLVVTKFDGSAGTLAEIGDTLTPAAFVAFDTLVGTSPDAAEAFIAFPVKTVVRDEEGQSPLDAEVRRRFDAHGNPIEILNLGDPSDPDDDLSMTLAYAVEDGVLPYLTDRPWQIVQSGLQGGLPLGSTLSRTSEILYDGNQGSPGAQALVRGNATRILRDWTDPAAGATQVAVDRGYDVYGNVIQVSSAYDVAGAGPESFVEYSFDSLSHTFVRTAETRVPGDDAYDLTVEWLYGDGEAPGDDPCGAPLGLGLWCKLVDPNGNAATRTYDDFLRVAATTGPNGAASAMLYHDEDRGTLYQRTETRVRWDPSGPADPASDGDAITRVLYTDGLLRPRTELRDGRGTDLARRRYEYDAAGRLALLSRWSFLQTPESPTLYRYDALGRLASQKWPEGDLSFAGWSVRSLSYAPRQVTATTTVPEEGLVQKRAVRFDAHGRPAAVDEYADPAGAPATTTYRFDPFGQLAVVSDAVENDGSHCGANPACPGQQHVTEILYDELGSRRELRDPDTGTSAFGYDARGLLKESTDARGKIQTYLYDPLGRLVGRHAENPGVLAQGDDVFTYGLQGTPVPSGLGRLVRVEDHEGEEAFEYDAAGNVSRHTRTVLDRSFDFQRTYDPLGRTLTTTYPDLEVVSWHYDKRLATRLSSSDLTDDYVADVSYDALDRALGVELGGSAGAPVLTRATAYEAISGRLDTLQADAGATRLADADYTIDGAGRIREVVFNTLGPGGSQLDPAAFRFDYDGLDRLTALHEDEYQLDVREYAYDALGNLLRKDFVSGAADTGFESLRYEDPTRPHALTEAASLGGRSVSYTYDAAGNVVVKRRVGDHGAAGQGVENVQLAYDTQGRIRRTRSSTGLTTLHRYGGLGQRLGTTQLGQNGDAEADLAVLGSDLTAFIFAFGSTTGGHADFTGDLLVASSDLTVLSLQFGGPLAADHVLTPEPGFDYHPGLGRVNKHFFLGGLRVASSARSWTAPSASLPPILRWELPEGAPPELLALAAGALGLMLLGLALQRRDRRLRPAGLRLRLGAVGTLLLVSPALLASPCGTGPPAPTTSLGTHGVSILFYVTDHLGSTILTVDSSGSVRNRYVFAPFGDPGAVQQGPALRHRFSGGEVLEQTGLYALGARLYDPETGRFLQPDPIAFPGDPQSLNAYTYALDNPISLVDPTGLEASESGDSSEGGSPYQGPPPWYTPPSPQRGPGQTRGTRGERGTFEPRNQAEALYLYSIELGCPGWTCLGNGVTPQSLGADMSRFLREPGEAGGLSGGAGGKPGKSQSGAAAREGSFNPVKFGVGAVNSVRGLAGLAAGTVTLGTSAGAEVVVGPLALPGTAVGTAQLAFGVANLKRGTQQLSESFEDRSGPSVRNLLGLLPFGQKFDDPVEPLPQDFFAQRFRMFVEDPARTGVRLLREFFAFGPDEPGGGQ